MKPAGHFDVIAPNSMCIYIYIYTHVSNTWFFWCRMVSLALDELGQCLEGQVYMPNCNQWAYLQRDPGGEVAGGCGKVDLFEITWSAIMRNYACPHLWKLMMLECEWCIMIMLDLKWCAVDVDLLVFFCLSCLVENMWAFGVGVWRSDWVSFSVRSKFYYYCIIPNTGPYVATGGNSG